MVGPHCLWGTALAAGAPQGKDSRYKPPAACQCPRDDNGQYTPDEPCKEELNVYRSKDAKTTTKGQRIAGQYQRWLPATMWFAFVDKGYCRGQAARAKGPRTACRGLQMNTRSRGVA